MVLECTMHYLFSGHFTYLKHGNYYTLWAVSHDNLAKTDLLNMSFEYKNIQLFLQPKIFYAESNCKNWPPPPYLILRYLQCMWNNVYSKYCDTIQ